MYQICYTEDIMKKDNCITKTALTQVRGNIITDL